LCASYAAPRITAIVGDLLLPTLGVFSSNGQYTPSNVTLLGSNFGPSSSPLSITYTSQVDGIVRMVRNTECPVPWCISGLEDDSALHCTDALLQRTPVGHVAVHKPQWQTCLLWHGVQQANLSACQRDVVGHAWISCFRVLGVGVRHAWVVNVSGQASEPSTQTTSFLPPTALTVYGPGGHNANTEGGQVVLIDGLDFGPTSASTSSFNDALISVTYGPVSNPTKYAAGRCVVSAARFEGSTLSCVTVEGTGGELVWTITVGNQTAAQRVGPTSYGWPVIATFQGAAVGGVTQVGLAIARPPPLLTQCPLMFQPAFAVLVVGHIPFHLSSLIM
jgi:hypothetical protein